MQALTVEKLQEITLEKGNHHSREDGVCALEAVAWLAGEGHTDHPACVCPALGAFVRKWNDDLDDAGRQRLKPYLPRLIGTKSSRAVESRRAWLVTDWMVRVHTPAWLRLAKLEDQALALEFLPPILNKEAARAGQSTLDAAQEKASAAWSAARSAAESAAWSAAESAAWSAARSAAESAAESAMEPTKLSLQESAFALLDSLIEAQAA